MSSFRFLALLVAAASSVLAVPGCGDDAGSGASPSGGGGAGGQATGGSGGSGGEASELPPLSLALVPTKTIVRASMKVARAGHTATLLADGRVLVIGGETLSTGAMLDAVEIYDPVTDSWTELAPLPEPRHNHTATLLSEGLVLVVGGGQSNAIGVPSGLEVVVDALLYDPSTGSSESLGPNVVPRHGHVAARLASGRVLIAAGAGAESEIKPAQGAGNPQPFGNALASAELFDPTTRTFELTGSLAQARYTVGSATLEDGRVMIAGGASYEVEAVSHATAELYDEATGSFASAGSFDGADRLFLGASRLEDGRVLAFGGKKSNVAFLDDPQVYDPASNSWTKFPDVPPSRTIPLVVPTAGGGALILGGYTCTPSACSSPLDVNLWSSDGSVAAGPEALRGRTFATATVLLDGTVLVAGGYGVNSQKQVELLYP